MFQVGADFATDWDFATLDSLDHDLLEDERPTMPCEETVDNGLEKLGLEFSELNVLIWFY